MKLITILLLFAGFVARAQQTYSISGEVNDENGKAIHGATIFITNSKYITSTNNEGKYIFDNVQPGSYEVVIKMLGFNSFIQDVIVRGQSVYLNTKLGKSSIMLSTVTINAHPDPKRKEYLELFTKTFLGETVNAQQCKILNPDVLTFHYDRQRRILTTTADDFIIVDNKALGYRIKYLLTEFELDENRYLCSIVGSPYFEELQGTEAQKKKWEEKRQIAYLSSSRHFFRAILNSTAKVEGYLAYKVEDDPAVIKEMYERSPAEIIAYEQQTPINTIKRHAIRIADVNSLFINDTKDFMTFKPNVANSGLFIIYTGAEQSPLYYKTGNPYELPIPVPAKERRNMLISQLIPALDTITIDRNYQWPGKGYIYSGYWAWLRIADLTPIDYFVDPLPEKKD